MTGRTRPALHKPAANPMSMGTRGFLNPSCEPRCDPQAFRAGLNRPPARSTWRGPASVWAIGATGWPSTTTCRHRQRGHGGGHRPCRRRHHDHPRRRRRHHAAQPCAAGRGRTVRHAGIALFPGRIDLGLGRAPGTDQRTARALRHRHDPHVDVFAEDVEELAEYFQPATHRQPVRAVPGAGLDVPLWILGSSLYGAQFAAARGLPYAFASHFAPAQLQQALAVYHREFRPSKRLAQPHTLLALNVVTAATDEEAARLFTTQQQAFVNLRRGRPGLVPPPLASAAAIDDYCTPAEKHMLDSTLACRAVGAPATVRAAMQAFVARHRPDELILTANIFEHAARVRSFELTMQAWTS
jgi:luciferase family oxidoreductase group 1